MFEKLGMKAAALLFGAMTLVACGGVCGDGEINENEDGAAEACDDGNATPGDGCNATCVAIEAGFDCPNAGQACVQLIEVCGDGIDNDADTLTDCEDADCNDPNGNFDPSCSESVNCNDNVDNDLDGAADCDDPECLALNPDGQCDQCGDGAISDPEVCDGPANGCAATCDDVLASLFESADDITGDQPDNLNTVIFGQGDADLDGDGAADARLVLVVASDVATECDIITASGGATYIGDVFGGAEAGTRAYLSVISFITPGVAVAAGDIFVGLSDVDADGFVDSFVDAGFIQNVGGAPLNDTTFGGDQDGVLTIQAAGATLDGGYSGFQQTEFIGGGAGINVGFNGTFQATECAGLNDQIDELMGAVFGF
jgi:cysteine-rich repeat protein